MGIPIEVPGLDTLIPEVPAGKVLLVESGPDPAKSFFVRRLALAAQRGGTPVTVVTSREKEEVDRLLGAEMGGEDWSEEGCRILELDTLKSWKADGGKGGLLVIDSFSYLTLDQSPTEVAQLMKGLRARARRDGLTLVLAVDRGMVDPKVEAVTEHLSDGMIEFHTREAAEGVTRFLRIPKWMDGKLVDRNVYYDFDGKRLAIDLRRRVI